MFVVWSDQVGQPQGASEIRLINRSRLTFPLIPEGRRTAVDAYDAALRADYRERAVEGKDHPI